MIKYFLLAILSVLTMVGARTVYAAPGDNPVNEVDCSGSLANSPVCQGINSNTNPLFGSDGVLTKAANIFAILTGVISTFMVIIGGLRYVNSAGDPSKTNSAKNTILYSAIGIAIASSAGIIARFILSRF